MEDIITSWVREEERRHRQKREFTKEITPGMSWDPCADSKGHICVALSPRAN